MNVAQIMISVFGKAENIVEKGGNAGHLNFLFIS